VQSTDLSVQILALSTTVLRAFFDVRVDFSAVSDIVNLLCFTRNIPYIHFFIKERSLIGDSK
jgi:hypothetical protein